MPDIAFIEAMEHAVMSGDPAAVARYLHEDIAYTVGARPTVHSIAAVLAYVAEQSRLARWEGHTLRAVLAVEDALVVEVISHFTRIADGRRISFPCADIYRFRDGRIADWRVYADISPFFQA